MKDWLIRYFISKGMNQREALTAYEVLEQIKQKEWDRRIKEIEPPTDIKKQH